MQLKYTTAVAVGVLALVLAAGLGSAAPAAAPIVLLPAGTSVTLRFLTPVDSSKARQGDTLTFAVAADVVVDHAVLIRAGSRVGGVVTRVTGPGMFGRSGEVVVGYLDVPTVDGGAVRLKDIVISRGTISTPEESAAGISLAGALVLGPVGLLAGTLIRGGAVVAPKGTVVFDSTAATAPVVIPTALIPVAPGTRLGLKFLMPVASATAKPGDLVALAVVGDVIVGHYVVVPARAPAVGMVLRVTRPGPYGTSGSVVIGALAARAADGGVVPLRDVVISRGRISTPQIAAGVAEAAGRYLLGQAGTVIGAWVHGGDVRAPAGTIIVDDTCGLVTVQVPRLPR